MAACGSLQHIFKKNNPLPENNSPTTTTLLQTLSSSSSSSWNLVQKPAEERSSLSSSFTEIFGELHFKESFVSTGDSNCSSSSSSFHRRSTSFSSTNSESLQLCTEGLGYESLDDVEDLKGEEEEEDKIMNDKERAAGLLMIRRTKSENVKHYFPPPPISCMGKSGKPWVGFKSYRYGGRFILKEIRVATHEFLHASRENGRLKLHILVPNEKQRRSSEDQPKNEHPSSLS